MTEHPITPPPELVQQLRLSSGTWLDQITNAYQAGADQELEACCQNMKSIPSLLGVPFGEMASNALRAARRPKPPSLKEQALEIVRGTPVNSAGLYSYEHVEIIRRALEQLDD
jgi:hypothetical protein